MSIVEAYKEEFKIYCYDEEISRGDKVSDLLKKSGFDITVFNSRGLFLESLKQDLPHVFVLYYQPLSLRFREMLTKVREASSEVEIILLGGREFWPGVHALLKAGLVDDFLSWPAAGPEMLELRLNKIIEKSIYKFIAEQRSDETAKIVERLDEQASRDSFQPRSPALETDISGLLSSSQQTESGMVEQMITQLKSDFPTSEFVYFKNYHSKDQLLVTRTSFASENYFRGQSIPFNESRLSKDRGEEFNRLRGLIEESFSCENFLMQPVEFADHFYGMIVAIHFEATPYLQKTAKYLSLALRNCDLEKTGRGVEVDNNLEMTVTKTQFPLALSREVSRARRLKLPVALIVSQIEYIGDEDAQINQAFEIIKQSLRSYDFICHLDKGHFAMVLPHCRYEDAAIKAETLRRQLVARGLKTQNTPLRLCFGVSEYPSLSGDSDALFEDAKQACSQVVVSGKNKVCLYSADDNFEPEFSTL